MEPRLFNRRRDGVADDFFGLAERTERDVDAEDVVEQRANLAATDVTAGHQQANQHQQSRAQKARWRSGWRLTAGGDAARTGNAVQPELIHGRLHRRKVDDLMAQRVRVLRSRERLTAAATRRGDAVGRRGGHEKFPTVSLVPRLTAGLSARRLALGPARRGTRRRSRAAAAATFQLGHTQAQHANLLESLLEQALQFGDACVAGVDRVHRSGEIILGDPCRSPVNAYSVSSVSVRLMVDVELSRMCLMVSLLTVPWVVESRSLCVMCGRVVPARGTHDSQSLRFLGLLSLHFFLLQVWRSWCCCSCSGGCVEARSGNSLS
jgi:hypothetical protein